MSNTMAEVLAEHQRKTGLRDLQRHCYCGWAGEPTGNAFIEHQASALSAAGFGLVADAKAEALREAAEMFKQRSDTLHNTMQEMTASKEYGLEDIVRYGAYSAEANGAATWLRTAAAKAAS